MTTAFIAELKAYSPSDAPQLQHLPKFEGLSCPHA